MKITPLEIRQKTFEKAFRGYEKEEVTAFLLSMSNEWERMIDDQKELRFKLDQSEKEVQKLREVESSLFKTLKTAEDTGANMIDQATKTAELHMKETQMNADALLSEAKSRAKAMIEKAELQSREIIEEMQDAVKELEQTYKAIENHRDDVISDLHNLSEDIVVKVNKLDKESRKFDHKDHSKRLKKLVRESQEMIGEEPEKLSAQEVKKAPVLKPRTEPPKRRMELKPDATVVPKAQKKEPSEDSSFFDMLDED